MTLPEVLITSLLSVFLIMAIVSFSFFLYSAKYEYEANIGLTNDARQLIEKLAWGIRQAGQTNRRGIAEAVSAVVTANTISYVDINGVTHSIRNNNGNIEYRRGTAGAWDVLLDPNGAPAYDATKYSTSLVFTQTNPRAVTVNLVLGKRIQGRWRYASITTQIFFRNS